MAKGPIPAPPSTTATPGPQLVPSTEPNATTAPIEVTGAESIVLSLEATGTEVVFGIPGGAILPTYDPLMSSKKLRHILVRHEQGGGHAAEGYAHATGRVGVCLATSGPGATNLGTAIANANMDSIPNVAINDPVDAALIRTDDFP